MAPLQLYYMATIFSPTASLVRQQFSSQRPRWISKSPFMQQHWEPIEQVFVLGRRQVSGLSISRDGSKAAFAVSGDLFYTIWNISTGQVKQKLEKPSGSEMRLEFSDDGSKLISVPNVGDQARIWSLATGQAEMIQLPSDSGVASTTNLEFRTDEGTIISIPGDVERALNGDYFKYSPDGHHAVFLKGSQAYICNMTTQRIEFSFEWFHEKKVMGVSNTRVVFQKSGTSIEIWDITTRSRVRTISLKTALITALAISPGGSKLALSVWSSPIIQIWNIETGEMEGTLSGHSKTIAHLSFILRDGRLVSTSDDGTARIWNVNVQQQQQQRQNPEAWPQLKNAKYLSLSHDGTRVASMSEDGYLRVWNLKNSEAESEIAVDRRGSAYRFAFSSNKLKLALQTSKSTAEVWDLATQKLEQTLTFGDSSDTTRISSIIFAFSPDGVRMLILRSLIITVWDVSTWEIKERFENEFDRGVPFSVAMSNNNSLVAVGFCNYVQIRDTVTKQSHKMVTNASSSNFPEALAFSPQGTRIASGWSDGTIRIWNIATKQTEWELQAHLSLVNALTYSADDSWNQASHYSLDRECKWICYGGSRVLALPRDFQRTSSFLNDTRGNTLAFVSDSRRVVAFIFEGAPEFID
jgi:WD40 repeat protein